MQTQNDANLQQLNVKQQIIYVFNPFLLTNVFATDLRWSNSTILISKNDFIKT